MILETTAHANGAAGRSPGQQVHVETEPSPVAAMKTTGDRDKADQKSLTGMPSSRRRTYRYVSMSMVSEANRTEPSQSPHCKPPG